MNLSPKISKPMMSTLPIQATYALRMAVAADTPPQPHPIYAAGGGGMERNQKNRSTKLEMRINKKMWGTGKLLVGPLRFISI